MSSILHLLCSQHGGLQDAGTSSGSVTASKTWYEGMLTEELHGPRFMPLESSIGQLEVAAYFAAVNALAFAAFAWDKRCARLGSWRVRERTLIWLALVGGSLGAFAGQQIMRHKTSKQPFRTQLSAVIGLQTIVIAGLTLLYARGAA